MNYQELQAQLDRIESGFILGKMAGSEARPLWVARKETKDPLGLWERLHAKRLSLGCWPVLLSAEESTLRILDQGLQEAPPEATILQQAAELEPTTALGELRRRENEEFGGEPGVDIQGEWREPTKSAKEVYCLVRSGATAVMRPGCLSRLFGAPSHHLYALIPAEQPWEIFSYLNYGDWNACPAAKYHVALQRYWYEAWGAEPVTLAHDTIELRVARSPSSKEQALELATVQYQYCPDIVDQGVETLANLASLLMSTKVWYFWWD